jgi:hypothetical protein
MVISCKTPKHPAVKFAQRLPSTPFVHDEYMPVEYSGRNLS